MNKEAHELLSSLGIRRVEGMSEPSEQAVHQLEIELGTHLPGDYRDFVTLHGGSEFDGGVVFRPRNPTPWTAPDGTESVTVIYGFGGDLYDLRRVRLRYEGQIPESLLAVADAEGGNQICLRLLDPERGNVLFWDHESGVVYLVAPTWIDFLLSLEREAEDDASSGPRPQSVWLDPDLIRDLQKKE